MNRVEKLGQTLFQQFGRMNVRLFGQTRIIRFLGKQTHSHARKQAAFANYAAQPSDVFIATYAKSGTNWAMQIAQQIAYYGASEFDNIHDLIAWPDAPMPTIKATLKDATLAARAPTGLRVIKTHLTQQYVPFNAKAKYIVVLRDPKEVLVSGYYFAHEIVAPLKMHFSAEAWLDLFKSSDYMFDSWAAHTASWWGLRHRDNVLLLDYATMKRDPQGSIAQIAELMDVTLSETQLAKVIAKSDISYMKANKRKFTPVMPGGVELNTIRAGQTGHSAELLTHAQQREVDAFCRAELQRLGCDFPYEQQFQLA